jgi:hypothetical protein
MKILLRTFLLFGVCFFVPSSVFPWSAVEHKVVARIAWDRLTPEAKRAVVELMLLAPADSQIGVIYEAGGKDPMTFFVNASVWADLNRAADRDRAIKYACPLWHYAEFTFGEAGVEVPDLPAFKPRQVNVLERLQFFQKALVDENEPIANRAVELVWTIHLVAEIHQPLHLVSRVTKEEPESDLGGNRFKLGQGNLHGYWDTILKSHFPQGEKADDVYIAGLAEEVTKKYSEAKLKESLAFTEPGNWARESRNLAESVVYSDVSRGRNPSAAYERRAIDVGERRIALAGYRLAQMLNRLFGSNARQSASTTAISENAQKIRARLDYDLACVASTLDSKTRELMIVKGTALEGAVEGKQVQGFDSQQVKRIIDETRQQLLESLADDQLAGLKAWAMKQFPDSNSLETIKVKAVQDARLTTDRETPYANHGAQQSTGVSLLSSVNALLGKVSEAISGTRKHSGPIRLQVLSNPQQGANIDLEALGKKVYSTSTNSFIADFFPGVYNVKVTKDGSVPINQPSVELGFGNSVIDCQLVSSGTAINCKFRP